MVIVHFCTETVTLARQLRAIFLPDGDRSDKSLTGKPLETTCQIQVGLLHSPKQVLLPLELQTPLSAAATS
jgi:hypothetical protein